MLALSNLLIFGIICGIAYAMLGGGQERYLRRRFLYREQLSFQEWYKRFYGRSGYDPDLVWKILKILSGTVRVQPTRFRPTDRLNVEFAYEPKWFLIDEVLDGFFEEIDYIVEKRYGKHWYPEETLVTLDDVIKSIMKQVMDK